MVFELNNVDKAKCGSQMSYSVYMRKFYEQVFVTNVPSFYKINLYNMINKRSMTLAVFTEGGDSTRNADFYKGDIKFDYINLGGKNFLSKTFSLFKIIFFFKYNTMILGGWDTLLPWICAFLSPKAKNALALESSILESETGGLKGFLKRIFLSRISRVYASGQMHKKLLDALGYKGDVIITKGVGIYNIVETPPFKPKSEVKNFIYVGRFIPCKNLENLVRAFEKFPDCTLTMVGFGELEEKLRSIAPKNVVFTGAVDNAKLPEYYRRNDVFILPSYSETWGVVVEEALNNGLPVIISENVGCRGDVVKDGINGIVFKFGSDNCIPEAIERARDANAYNYMAQNIRGMDFKAAAKRQVECYLGRGHGA